MLRIGHRGLMGIAPENTLESFTAALNHGMHMIEMDLRYYSGVIYVCHDVITKEEIPGLLTLQEVLSHIARRCDVYLDVKETAVVHPLVKILTYFISNEAWAPEQFYVASFNHHHVTTARELLPTIKYGFSYGCVPLGLAESAVQRGIDFVVLDVEHLEHAEFVIYAKKHDLQVFVYTVNTEEDLLKCWKLGVDGIITDYPWKNL